MALYTHGNTARIYLSSNVNPCLKIFCHVHHSLANLTMLSLFRLTLGLCLNLVCFFLSLCHFLCLFLSFFFLSLQYYGSFVYRFLCMGPSYMSLLYMRLYVGIFVYGS